ncbi:hypothetical protein BJ166DRAFT_502711 [Pestalotiopsis sp. NC0098]|nr:hypothetical protein BJ166DRAFT_502711 [Pestalotiopsis sp. NC0098]
MALGAVKASSCIQATGALPGSHGQKYSTLTMMVVTPSGTVLTRATSRLKNLDCRSLPLSLCLVSIWQLEKDRGRSGQAFELLWRFKHVPPLWLPATRVMRYTTTFTWGPFTRYSTAVTATIRFKTAHAHLNCL